MQDIEADGASAHTSSHMSGRMTARIESGPSDFGPVSPIIRHVNERPVSIGIFQISNDRN
ncbi:hypothetical protein L3X40_16715 [Rhizorhapis sp. SPR117]|nr:hypothetical protein [Rhizorhapis sp. SPR117]